MSDFPAFRSLDDIDAEEGGKDLPSFDVDLFEAENFDEGFRTQNDPHDPYQRTDVVQRRGAVFIKCKCVDVIHGTWEAGSDQKASLIVLSFRFYPRKPGRRIKHAEMEFRFIGDPSARRQPEVVEMSLDGHFSLVPTTRSEEHTTGVEGTAGGGALGLEISSTLKWEQKITQETGAATYIAGSTFTDPANLPRENSVSWALSENPHTKGGIPDAIRVGILIKRPNDDDFRCSVKLKTKGDFKTEWDEVWEKRHQADDDLLFKADLPPTNTLMKYDVENLGSVRLRDVEMVTMTTVLEDAIKKM